MAATTMQEVLASLDDVVLQRTLSLEAYQSVAALKEQAAKTDAENKRLKETLAEQTKENLQLAEKLSAASVKLGEVSTRERAVAERETKVTSLEIAAAVAQAESKTFRHCLGVVFAPNTVRESVQRWGSVAQNGMSVPVNDGGGTQHTEGYGNPDNPPPAPNASDRTHLG